MMKQDEESADRVGVFIDGQNVTIGARYAFDDSPHGYMHPLLLARSLAGRGTLVEVRYATGIPSPDVDPERYDEQRRRHDLMALSDVVVLERHLRYRWEWDIRDRDLGDPRDHKGQTVDAKVRSRNRGQEKGIDVWLGLDAITMCARSDIDRVIIVSADSDLDLVPTHLRMIEGQEHTKVFQAKVLSGHRELITPETYDGGIAIDQEMFEYARDDFDYAHELDNQDVAEFLARVGAANDAVPERR